MGKLTRRDFVKKSLATAAGVGITSVLPMKVWARVAGANDAVRVAIIGLGGDRVRFHDGKSAKVEGSKGSFMIPEFRNTPSVRVVALCDVDTYNLERDLKKFDDTNEKVDTYVDVRKLLDRKDIDAVYIATPNTTTL